MLSEDLKQALGVALNEATLLGLEVDAERRLAGATFAVLSLPADGGPMPKDARVQLLFSNVTRVAASLRGGRWNDLAAPVQPFALEDLLSVVQSFGGLPVYGWEFFDVADQALQRWGDRLSLDWQSSEAITPQHDIGLFQDAGERCLDVCLWFDELEIRLPTGAPMTLDDFASAGKRWWDAFYQNDPRTQGLGMAPLK